MSLLELSTETLFFQGIHSLNKLSLENPNGKGAIGQINLTNKNVSPIGFKFKTNQPQRYSVKPVFSVLKPGEKMEVFLRCEDEVLKGDKFMVQMVILEDDDDALNAHFWKTIDSKRVEVIFIECLMVRNQQRSRTNSLSSQEEIYSKGSTSSKNEPKIKTKLSQSFVPEKPQPPNALLPFILLSVLVLLLGIFMPSDWVDYLYALIQ